MQPPVIFCRPLTRAFWELVGYPNAPGVVPGRAWRRHRLPMSSGDLAVAAVRPFEAKP